MIAILEYGAGNQTSVQRALQYLGIPNSITADRSELAAATGVIFPGVGQAGQAMAHLQAAGLDKVLQELVAQQKPLLGVCLGCQIMLDHCSESNTPGLGLVQGESLRFADDWQDGGMDIKIPHMGWNTLKTVQESPLLAGLKPTDSFYFVHSYYVQVPKLALTTTNYGQDFVSIYGRNGLWGVQFHPEKSGEPGLRLLANFAGWCQNA